MNCKIRGVLCHPVEVIQDGMYNIFQCDSTALDVSEDLLYLYYDAPPAGRGKVHGEDISQVAALLIYTDS